MKTTVKTASITLAAAALAFTLGYAHPVFAATSPDATAPSEQISPEERLKRNQVSAATDIGDGNFREEQQKGLGGDREAALRVAHMFKTGTNGVPKDERRMLQWLLHASTLSSGAASYQLYQYFLDQKLDREAVFFENRAIEQGFTPPPRVDPKRG
jgi:TPR repeat protein